jgi:hypothetical protein
MEKQMYPIIKNFFENQGYKVHSEIEHIDMVAIKEDIMIAIEMKDVFSIGLMYQGVQRLHSVDLVYLAIPRPSYQVLTSKLFKEKRTIVRRLELGLLLVDLKKESIEVLFESSSYHLKKSSKRKEKLLTEFKQRKTNINEAGTNRVKIMTAYKEHAIKILDFMSLSPKTTKEIYAYTKSKKSMDILQKNYYKWFERVDRGIYQMSEHGKKYYEENQKILDLIHKPS